MTSLQRFFRGGSYLVKKMASELSSSVAYDSAENVDNFVIYQCRKCGYWSKSLGVLHGHLESHTPIWSMADIERFNELTRKIVVTEYREEELGELGDEFL